MVSGYNVTMRAKIIDRWDALETGKATPMMATQSPHQVKAIERPDPQAFAVVQTAWVDAVHHKIASKREALQFLRDASAVMIHGVDILQRAAKAAPTSKALSAPVQATLSNGDSVAYALRAQGTMSATDLLRENGSGISAKAFYELLEKPDMVITRHEAKSQVSYRVLIGEGLQYGQNVMTFEGTRSNPYFYVSKFAALLERLGSLVTVETEAVPKPSIFTPQEKALHRYKTMILDAWHISGREVDAEANFAYVTRAALLAYLVEHECKPLKTASNMLAPRRAMMAPLIQAGFCRPHNNGWLVTGSLAA